MFDNPHISLSPIHFFSVTCDCRYLSQSKVISSVKSYLLPSTERLSGEKSFAKVAVGWNEEGVAFYTQVNQCASQSFYPELERGDSIELFIDTRDLKSSGLNTRFCHHFFFLPQPVEGIERGEKTHFRTEDVHPLCSPQSLVCRTQLKKNDYSMEIFIPSESLYGYDPAQFNRLGFTYRINRSHGKPQHFSAISPDYQIDQQPSLWGSLNLIF